MSTTLAKEEFAILPNHIAGSRAVHVTIPVSLAYDFDKMQAVTKTVLGKLGHLGCHSGFDLRFLIEDNFRFNEKGDLLASR